MVALIAAVTVAFKQLVPEHTVNLFSGIVSIRVKVGSQTTTIST